MPFIIFFSFVVFMRIEELFIARRNEKWLLQNGAIEYGRSHYPFIVVLHILFLLSMVVEYLIVGPTDFSPLLIGVYLLLVVLKFWVIVTLGKFWNTRIYRVPNTTLVSKGLYRYVKHPNYIIVVAELIVIPLAFHLYCTMFVFSLLNAAMLYVRISTENKALAQ